MSRQEQGHDRALERSRAAYERLMLRASSTPDPQLWLPPPPQVASSQPTTNDRNCGKWTWWTLYLLLAIAVFYVWHVHYDHPRPDLHLSRDLSAVQSNAQTLHNKLHKLDLGPISAGILRASADLMNASSQAVSRLDSLGLTLVGRTSEPIRTVVGSTCPQPMIEQLLTALDEARDDVSQARASVMETDDQLRAVGRHSRLLQTNLTTDLEKLHREASTLFIKPTKAQREDLLERFQQHSAALESLRVVSRPLELDQNVAAWSKRLVELDADLGILWEKAGRGRDDLDGGHCDMGTVRSLLVNAVAKIVPRDDHAQDFEKYLGTA